MSEKLLELTADIVSAYVSQNPIPASDLGSLIADVNSALSNLGGAGVPSVKTEPAVNPKRSVHPDHIVCLEDGKSFQSLKRHLMAHHQMTPAQYRAKWNLAHDYPMVAPNYASKRSDIAKTLGLGRKSEPKRRPRHRRRP